MSGQYNFHEDPTLHAQNAASKTWLSDPLSKVAAAGKGAVGFLHGGIAAAAKEAVVPLDVNDPMSRAITKTMVSMLWGSMLHPPLSFRGEKHQYRTADGSYHNPMFPNLGKAGTPYAKSVQGTRAQKGARPQPEDLFDLLMARPDGDHHESDTGISSMLLYQATIVIHDVFRSNDFDRNISDTSSYLDLAPLYGKDQETQDTVRTFENGMLKPDTFAEHRLLNQPPGVSIFLIMYNRFHNYVAERLLKINENDRFSLPADYSKLSSEQKKEARKAQDQELFQTARLITCGLYAQVAIHDYLRTLMMIHQKDTPWTLDPRTSFPERFDKKGLQRGEGNMVSVEFNLLYRFHSPLSARDNDWSTALFKKWLSMGLKRDAAGNEVRPTDEEIRSGKHITSEMIENEDVPVPFMQRMIAMANVQSAKEKKAAPYFPAGFDGVGAPRNTEKDEQGRPRPSYMFNRDAEGKFDDRQLVAELIRCSEDPICSFGSQNVPKIFKSIEMIGILQARKWEVASLNEFREFFGMARHESFADINSDPHIQQTLRDLYDDVDQVELYPGYLVEGQGRACDPNKSCANGSATTLWRGIFSDAVTLVRSDRFYTLDWNIDSLTTWGMSQVTSDPNVNKGGMLYRLYHHAFPGFFHYNSLHLWQPYHTPASNLILAQRQGHLDKLNIDGLEFQFDGDSEWQTLEYQRDTRGKITTDFARLFKIDEIESKRCAREAALKELGRKLANFNSGKTKDVLTKEQYDAGRRALPAVPMFRLRRKLEQVGSNVWRGGERADLVTRNAAEESDYKTIREKILGGEEATNWLNRDIGLDLDLPDGALRRIMRNEFKEWKEATDIFGQYLMGGADQTQVLRSYLDELAEQLRSREERDYSAPKAKSRVYQLDIVRDFSVPFVVRFVADVLGFWEQVKTKEFPDREFDENEIYTHIENCQKWRSWDADQTRMMQRREAFKTSIAELKKLADAGVAQSSKGWFDKVRRSYGREGDGAAVQALRKNTVSAIQALLAKGYSQDTVAAFMLSLVLETANTAVIKFTEILAYFLHPEDDENAKISDTEAFKRDELWAALQIEANKTGTASLKAAERIDRAALEAWRLSTTLKPAFRYSPSAPNKTVSLSNDKVIKNHDLVLLDLRTAMQDERVFPRASEFDWNRPLASYLIYGSRIDSRGAEKATASPARLMTITVLSGMLKHVAKLRRLRPAHGKAGRLRAIPHPDPTSGIERLMYLNAQWDALTAWPATWTLRYDGLGSGVAGSRRRWGVSDGMLRLQGPEELGLAKTDAQVEVTTTTTKTKTETTAAARGEPQVVEQLAAKPVDGVSVCTTEVLMPNA